MIDVVCVKWGTEYSDDYVKILKAMVERNTTIEHRFLCFTDKPIDGIECIELPSDLTGWWNKIYLFKQGNTNDRVVYFDLDTMLTGNIDFLMEYNGPLMGIENVGVNNRYEHDREKYRNVFQTGVLAWKRDHAHFIWDVFNQHKEQIVKNIRGDGEFLHILFQQNQYKPDLLQHLHPGKLKSYKYEVYEDGLDDQTAIVCFHGTPRPHEAMTKSTFPWGLEYKANPWIGNYWRV